jgi:hypothetical protein
MAKAAKAVPRVTPTQSKWRIWDPGRSKAIVFREVIVRIKDVRSNLIYGRYTCMCPGRTRLISVAIHNRFCVRVLCPAIGVAYVRC